MDSWSFLKSKDLLKRLRTGAADGPKGASLDAWPVQVERARSCFVCKIWRYVQRGVVKSYLIIGGCKISSLGVIFHLLSSTLYQPPGKDEIWCDVMRCHKLMSQQEWKVLPAAGGLHGRKEGVLWRWGSEDDHFSRLLHTAACADAANRPWSWEFWTSRRTDLPMHCNVCKSVLTRLKFFWTLACTNFRAEDSFSDGGDHFETPQAVEDSDVRKQVELAKLSWSRPGSGSEGDDCSALPELFDKICEFQLLFLVGMWKIAKSYVVSLCCIHQFFQNVG